MPTLKDIAKQIGGLTVAKAPQSLKGSGRKRPGNLKRALARANTPDKVLKTNPKTKSFSFEINYAPPGAEYGMWWNDLLYLIQLKTKRLAILTQLTLPNKQSILQ